MLQRTKESEAAVALKDLGAVRGMRQMSWADIGRLGYDTGRRAGVVRRAEFASWMLERMR